MPCRRRRKTNAAAAQPGEAEQPDCQQQSVDRVATSLGNCPATDFCHSKSVATRARQLPFHGSPERVAREAMPRQRRMTDAQLSIGYGTLEFLIPGAGTDGTIGV